MCVLSVILFGSYQFSHCSETQIQTPCYNASTAYGMMPRQRVHAFLASFKLVCAPQGSQLGRISNTFLDKVRTTLACLVLASRLYKSSLHDTGHLVQVPTLAVETLTTMSHVNGSKQSATETGKKGEFVRKASGYRSVVQKGGKYSPEGSCHCICSGVLNTSACIHVLLPTTMTLMCSRQVSSLHCICLSLGQSSMGHNQDEGVFQPQKKPGLCPCTLNSDIYSNW